MLYIERQPSKRSVLLLVFMALALYLGALALPVMHASDEAVNAAIARDMVATHQFLKTHLYGHPVKSFPLYPWLVVLCSGFQAPSLFTLRLPALLSLWGLTWLVGGVAWRLQSAFAGWVAAAVVLTSVAGLRIGCQAQTDILQALLLFAAWYSWFHLGFEQKRWAWAWGTAHALVFLAVLAVGGKAIFWFYFPLFFTRRPLNAGMRMQMPAHLVSAACLALAITVWLVKTPDQPFMPWNVEPGLKPAMEHVNYLWHLVFYPWQGILYLGGWCLLVWSPFCIALRQFEHNHSACILFRTICISLGVVLWVWPNTTPRQLLPLLAPMSVLIGIHFEIVIRRHQQFLNKILRFTAWCICAVGTLACLIWICLATNAIHIVCHLTPSWQTTLGIAVSGLLALTVFLVWFLILRKNTHSTFRSSIIWSIFGIRIIMLCTIHPWNAWNHADKRLAGQTLAGLVRPETIAEQPAKTLRDFVSKDEVIYYLPSKEFNYLCLVETFYLGHRIRLLDTPAADLPDANKDVVYVLSSRIPAIPTRNWEPISPPVDMTLRCRGRLVSQSRRTRPFLIFGRLPITDDSHLSKPLLVYRGEIKKTKNTTP